MPRFTFLYSNPDAHAAVLIAGLLDQYGADVLEWEPQSLEMHIKEDQKLTNVPDVVMDKIQAAMVLLTTNQFYMYSEAFENIATAFNHMDVEFRIMTPVSPEEAAWTILEAELINPTDASTDTVYEAEILKYLRTVLDTSGICEPPEVFLSIGVSEGPGACSMYPENSTEIEKEQKMKKLRIEAYINHQFSELTQQLKQYFPGRPHPTLQQLLERRHPAQRA